MPDNGDLLKRITVRLEPSGGKAVIRDMPISVGHILGMMSEGETNETILAKYDFLEPEDLQACIIFAYRHISGEEVYDNITTLPPAANR